MMGFLLGFIQSVAFRSSRWLMNPDSTGSSLSAGLPANLLAAILPGTRASLALALIPCVRNK